MQLTYKSLLLPFLAAFMGFDSLGQSSRHLSGIVVDSITKQAIPFAHVRLGADVSISNQQGKYAITYDVNDTTQLATFSCVGYSTRRVAISTLLRSSLMKLTTDTTILPEVLISNLSAQAIIRKCQKKGLSNYLTPRYAANYAYNQIAFFEGSTEIIGIANEKGIVTNRALDTTGTFPIFKKTSVYISEKFLQLDTIANGLTSLTNRRNTVPVETVYSFDPIRIGLLSEFHAVPTMFSKDFYENTEMTLASMVTLNHREYFLITVFQKNQHQNSRPSKDKMRQLESYKNRLREIASKSGQRLSEQKLDSIFSNQVSNRGTSKDVAGFFLVDAKTFAIVNAVIKVTTFDPSGNIYARLNVSASYKQVGKSYYLENLDVLIKRSAPQDYKDSDLYYLLSLNVFNIKKGNSFRSDELTEAETKNDNSEIAANLEPFKTFIMPVKNCAHCSRNPITIFNQKL